MPHSFIQRALPLLAGDTGGVAHDADHTLSIPTKGQASSFLHTHLDLIVCVGILIAWGCGLVAALVLRRRRNERNGHKG